MSEAQRPESTLSTLEPDPIWDAESHEDAVDALGDDDLVFHIWGGDWCGDCRQQLPALAAALDAAGVPDERIHAHAVEREDGEKVGEGIEEYEIERIPTVIVEWEEQRSSGSEGHSPSNSRTQSGGGEEIARFVEREDRPIAAYLAAEIDAAE